VTATARPDLSVVIVNFNSGWLTANLVQSLLAEKITTPAGARGSIEVIVVENRSPIDQRALLDPLTAQGVQVLYSAENRGYGGGCNDGFARARGEHVLFMNPDVLLIPGALDTMLAYLRANPDVGQVGPRGWFDAHRFFFLPSIELPTVRTLIRQIRARMTRAGGRRFARRRSHHALRIWTTREPLIEEVIAGYAFMMPSALARELGPFDEDYPFYFEDSDLSRRIRRGGKRCVLLPQAEMVHFYNKSAGQVYEQAMEKHARSQRVYYRKYYGERGEQMADAVNESIGRYGSLLRGWTFADPRPIGAHRDPPVIMLPRKSERYLAELTLDPMFTLAVGHLGSGDRFQIAPGAWDALEPARFFVRVIDLPSDQVLGTWQLDKTKPIEPVPSHAQFLRILAGGS
jgi:GT2 family glycosyltransferase